MNNNIRMRTSRPTIPLPDSLKGHVSLARRAALPALMVFFILRSILAADPPSTAAADSAITMQQDVSYLNQEPTDDLARKMCLLDLYLPKYQDQSFPLIVWFHGGALKGGSKTSSVSVLVAKSLAKRGIGVILAEYRHNPQVKFPVYITDAAQAVRWASENASSLNAQANIFVGGHSAGGYIAALLAMDGHYLKDAGVAIDKIAGFISMSGQMMTHFTVAEERGISSTVITADDAAPIHYLRKDLPPLLLLIGDKDWPARLEENQYFYAALKKVGDNPNVSFRIIPDRDHGGILSKTAEDRDPAATAIIDFMETGALPPEPTADAPESSP